MGYKHQPVSTPRVPPRRILESQRKLSVYSLALHTCLFWTPVSQVKLDSYFDATGAQGTGMGQNLTLINASDQLPRFQLAQSRHTTLGQMPVSSKTMQAVKILVICQAPQLWHPMSPKSTEIPQMPGCKCSLFLELKNFKSDIWFWPSGKHKTHVYHFCIPWILNHSDFLENWPAGYLPHQTGSWEATGLWACGFTWEV